MVEEEDVPDLVIPELSFKVKQELTRLIQRNRVCYAKEISHVEAQKCETAW